MKVESIKVENINGDSRNRVLALGLWCIPFALLFALGSVQAQDPSFEDLQVSEDPSLLLEWGKRYFYGVRASQDIDKAIQLYCAAGRRGSGEAQYRLGELYARSVGGKKDEVLAASWLLKAALSKFDAARPRLAQWDLTDADLAPEPGCVLSGQMVARTLPRARRSAAPPAKIVQPTVAPKLVGAPNRPEIERLVRELAPTYGLSPELVLAVVEVESNFDPKAQSRKKAQGLMQLIPPTAKRFGVSDPWDAHQNLRGGMAYLRWLLDYFDGDLRLALAGYNAGEQAVTRHGGVPPYAETRAYLRRVARALGVSEETLSKMSTGPAAVARPRKSERDTDWESRFFEVGVQG